MTARSIFIFCFIFFLQVCYAQDMHAQHAKQKSPEQVSSDQFFPITAERLQSIGATYESVKRRNVDKIIRTVGRIEPDERLVSHIHVKFEGWIEQLFVNFTGEKVTKDEPLFSVYSPDLVATQQEFLLVLHSQHVEGATAALDAATQRLLFWDVPKQTILELKKTGKATKTVVIRSPIAGTVIQKTALQGMRIEPTMELYTIADLSHVWILSDIYESELLDIHMNQEANISLSYYPKEIFKANIQFIEPTVDAKTRTVKVRLELNNADRKLKPGMYTNVEIKIPLQNLLFVPKNAVLLTGDRAIIFVYHKDGKIEWRSVKLGVRAGDWIEVLSGIQEGENIITSANFLIDSESQLKAAMAGMQH